MPDSNSLIVIILDVSPFAWGSRSLQRQVQDKARISKGKRSLGPATLEEVLDAIQALSSSACSIERDAGLIIMGVADDNIAVLYPRKDVLAEWLEHPDSYQPNRQVLASNLVSGVADLVAMAAAQTEKRGKGIYNNTNNHVSASINPQAAIAAAFSRALCLVNRFLVAAKSSVGLSALSEDRFLQRTEDAGLVALMGNNKKKNKPDTQSAWSPRIMIIQASEDRGRDYNAIMNCAFAAVKHNITVDGCFMMNGMKDSPTSSAFLEQICDLTNGVYSAPTGAAQVGGALTEVLFSVFLPPIATRRHLNLPSLTKVDFRARCFQTGQMVDTAFCCNQCLSVFSNKPQGKCPTCEATIAVPTATHIQK